MTQTETQHSTLGTQHSDLRTGGVAILDFGSQYTQLIARRVREQGVYAEVFPCDADIEKVNPGLKGVLPKDYNRPALDKMMLGELIDLVSGIATGEPSGCGRL